MTVLVDDDSIVEIAIALNLRGKGRVRTTSKLGLDVISMGLADEDRRDRNGRIAPAHSDYFIADVVHDDRRNRTSRFGIGHLLHECAISAVDERDFSGDCRTVHQRGTTVGRAEEGRIGGVESLDDIPRDPAQRERRTELGVAASNRFRDGCRRVDGHPGKSEQEHLHARR